MKTKKTSSKTTARNPHAQFVAFDLTSDYPMIVPTFPVDEDSERQVAVGFLTSDDDGGEYPVAPASHWDVLDPAEGSFIDAEREPRVAALYALVATLPETEDLTPEQLVAVQVAVDAANLERGAEVK